MPLNNTLTQTLQALERGRQAAHDKQQKEEAIKIEAAASAVQSALDSASILIKNRELERRLEAQNKKLLGLKIELDSASLVVEEEKRRCHKAKASLEMSYASKLTDAERVRKEQVEELEHKLSAEKEEKSALEKQFAMEKQDAKGLLMDLSEQQTEAQWKRKLSHLRAEHRDLLQERDHYKRLCRSLQPAA